MTTKIRNVLQALIIGCALMFGSVGLPAVMAQDTPDAAAVEEDDGFDDWGLLGLLGLGGLAGLRRRPEAPRVVDRTDTTQR